MNEMELLLIIKDELVKLDPLELILGNSKLIDEYDLEAKYILDEMTNINESNLLAIIKVTPAIEHCGRLI